MANEQAGVIEYKGELARPQYASHPSYRALSKLATDASLPFFTVRYATDFSFFKIVPMNLVAKRIIPERVEVNERLFVHFLYNLRGKQPPKEIFDILEAAI